MGINYSGNSTNRFLNKLQTKYDFIVSTKDDHLGPIKIYRKRQPFYDYLMVVQKTIPLNSLQIYEQQLSAIYGYNSRTDEESMLLKLYGHQLPSKSSILSLNSNSNGILSTQCQPSTIRIILYLEYYNFTLKQLVEYKSQLRNTNNKNKKSSLLRTSLQLFELDEVMYILWNIVHIYRFFQHIDAVNVEFHSSQIYITPQGEIRFNPILIFQSQTYMDNNTLQSNNSRANTDIKQTQCLQSINCLQYRKFTKTFQMKQNLIVYEIKKIVNQLIVDCDQRCFNKNINSNRSKCNTSNTSNKDYKGNNNDSKMKQSQQLYLLKKYINNASTISQIEKLLYLPEIDKLKFNTNNNNINNLNNDAINKNNYQQQHFRSQLNKPPTSSSQQTATNSNQHNFNNNHTKQYSQDAPNSSINLPHSSANLPHSSINLPQQDYKSYQQSQHQSLSLMKASKISIKNYVKKDYIKNNINHYNHNNNINNYHNNNKSNRPLSQQPQRLSHMAMNKLH